MFKRRHSRGYSGRRSAGFQRPRHSFRGPRRPKSLDPRLFVRPAVFEKTQAVSITHSFADFNLHAKLNENLTHLGFTTPTPIQDQALIPALSGQDVIGLADTGTGKTVTFVLPILNKIIANPSQTALIVAPTRELAVQIRDDITALSQGLNLKTSLLIGGAPLSRQIKELHYHPSIIIGTPGRLKDLNQRRALNLSQTQTVVLDEMDRMLDMGFVTDITTILNLLPRMRQTLLFSATIDDRVESIARTFMASPLKISVKTGATAQNVDQNIVRVIGDKFDTLKSLLRQDNFHKVIIFGRTKFAVEKLNRNLTESGFVAGSIHGNKRQSQRQRVLNDFRHNQIKILIATDVAARGLDIKDITHVINYDAPESYEDYIHRIGRTGRAGKTGYALTFVE